MKAIHLMIALLALGLLAGCAAIDHREQQTLMQHHVSPAVYDRMLHGDVLSLSDIIELTQRQIPPNMIIGYLDSTRAVYMLDKPGLARLKQGKVDQAVVDYLVDTPARFGPRPYYYGRPYPYDAYYPYYPYYYGSTSVVFVGGGRGHWR